MLSFLILLVVGIVVAMMWTEGLWGNAITFLNTLFAAMMATNYFEPTADFFEEMMPSYTYLWDLIALWILFAIFLTVSRVCTDLISRHRVRFRAPVELGGNLFFGFCTAIVVVMFLTMSLHTAPLARTAVRGSFQKEPTSGNFFGLAPDRMWLAFMQSRSRGALSRADESWKSPHDADQGKRVFDPNSEFVLKYGARRQNLYEHMKNKETMRVK